MKFPHEPVSFEEWSAGPQPLPEHSNALGWPLFGVGLGALGLLGNTQLKRGYRGFDLYADIARGVEEYSPGRVFRTFQVSHLLSPFETASQQTRYFSPSLIHKFRGTRQGSAWLHHTENLIGSDFLSNKTVAAEGFRFEGGQLLAGRTGQEVLLKHAGVVRSPTAAGPLLQEAYARSVAGGPFNIRHALTHPVPFIDEAGNDASELFMFTGGKSRLHAAARSASGYGTYLIERFNRLANAPAELPIIRDLFKHVPILNRGLGVASSSGLKTLGKLSLKFGLGLPAVYLGYQQLDHWTRQAGIFDGTLLSEGLTAAGAGIWARSQMALSHAADWLNLHTYRERQEQIAPRSTELSTVLGLPIIGAFTGLSAGYLRKVYGQIQLQRSGYSLAQASGITAAEDALFKKAVYGTEPFKEIVAGLDEGALTAAKRRAVSLSESWLGRSAKFLHKFAPKRTHPMGIIGRAIGELSPAKAFAMAGAALGALLVAPFVPGALVPSKRPEELDSLYSGQQRVEVRKGRWWESGGTPWEGGRIDRFQQHWYPRLLARAKEKSIYGDDSPIAQWFKRNFTYDYEMQHYYDRPYPVSSPAFADVPIVGPLLAATVGQVVKPSVMMHPENYVREGADGEEQYRQMPLGWGERRLSADVGGELSPGAPISPHGFKGTVGEQLDTMADVVGLPGYIMKSIKERVSGRPGFYEQETQLASFGDVYSPARTFYDEETGGWLGLNEFLRRLYPRPRKIDQYNPLRNTMPDWLPGAGDKSENFLIGDPFTKVALGEERLPGVGYAALHPELEGIAPEEYPLHHKLSILSDIAPYSDKYKEHLSMMRSRIARKEATAEDIATYQRVTEEVRQRKTRKQFTPYQYRDREYTPMEAILAAANEDQKTDDGEPSWFESALGGYWETLGHTATASPLEYLTPFRPAQKFLHMRTAVEDYEQTQLYGTSQSFWNRPIRDFLKPFATSMGAAMGWDNIPEHVQEKRDLQEYFDLLKYVKYTRLKRSAQAEGDEATVKEAEQKRRETLFGINPYTQNHGQLMRALPRDERDYFQAFSEADMEERARILGMVPENEQALYIARWQLKDAADMQKAIKAGLLSDEQVAQAEGVIDQLYAQGDTEGLPRTQDLWREYLETRLAGETYPDWYRRVYLLEEALEGKDLPGPSWIGWHPSVDLDDVKLKVVEYLGQNMAEHDLWPDRARQVARRPQVNEAADEVLSAMNERENPEDVKARLLDILAANGIRNPHVSVLPAEHNHVELQLDQDRSADILQLYRRGELG